MVSTENAWVGPHGVIIFEISGFDYVGLDPKSIDYGP